LQHFQQTKLLGHQCLNIIKKITQTARNIQQVLQKGSDCKKHSASVTKGITDCKKHSASVTKGITDCKNHSANVTKGIVDCKKHSASVTKPKHIHKAKSHYEQTTVLSLQMETRYNALELSRLPIQLALHIMIIFLHHLLQ
jgi:septal ring factor EnvC (AmiA/AmiB activator)